MSMQATAVDGRSFDASGNAPKRGFWSRLIKGMVAAREREARLRISQHLQSIPDQQLRQIGFDDSEIRALRTTGILPKHMAD